MIAYLAGPEGAFGARERLSGFIQALKNSGRPFSPDLIMPYTANLDEGYRTFKDLLESDGISFAAWNETMAYPGWRGARLLLEGHPEVDALVCFGDQVAFGALKVCAELGRRVPEEFPTAVVSYCPSGRENIKAVAEVLFGALVPSAKLDLTKR